MDEPAYAMMDQSIWGMILGKSGKLPGAVAPEIIELAKQKGYEFTEANPQDNYPDELPTFIDEMKNNNWERGQDDEELFELAMHPTQYRDYKSGVAKQRFEEDLAKAKAAKITPASSINPAKTAKTIVDNETLAAISLAIEHEISERKNGVITIKPYDSPWSYKKF